MMSKNSVSAVSKKLLFLSLSAAPGLFMASGAMAQTCQSTGVNQTCANTGTTNGNISDTGNLTLNNSGTLTSTNPGGTINARGVNITNSGTISNTADGMFFSAIIIGDGLNGTSGQITNSGTISNTSSQASTIAVMSGSPPLTITNSAGGLINATGYIALEINANTLTTINNDGEITGNAAAIVKNLGTLGLTVTNNGLIKATNGVALVSRNGQFTLNNNARGVITGTTGGVQYDGGTGANIINNGRISGDQRGLYVASSNSQTLKVITNNAGASITSANGNGIQIRDNNTTINNYGTISGGTSAVFIESGSNNIFNIYNGAVFTGGIDYNNRTGNTTNFYTGSYTLGVKNYSVTGNTINLKGAATQLVTSGLNVQGTGDIVVVAPQVVASASSGASNVSAAASTVTNAVLNSPIVPALSGFTPEAPAPGIGGPGFQPASLALDPTFAERLQEAFPETKLTNLNQTADLGMTRVKQGQSVDVNGNLVWVRGFGATRNLPSTATVVGNGNTSIGMLFGYDRQFEDWRIGAYAGYAYGYTRMLDASGTLGSDYYVAGLYGRRSFGAYTVTANLSGGVMGNRSSRSINNGAEQAIGSFGGFFIAPELALSYDMALGDNMTLTPTLRGRYVGAFLPGYSENGSSQNVTYGSNSAHALEERLELKLTKAFRGEKGLTSSIYVQVAALANQRIGADGFNASLLGTDFTVTNPYSRSTVGGLVGVGVEHQFDRQITGFAGADAALYSDSTLSFTGRAGLKVSF